MSRSFIGEIALRYTLWGHGIGVSRRHLSSFLSLLSAAGLVLAVALLALVLSVMNGFDREMRENILSLVPQLTIRHWPAAAQREPSGPERVALLQTLKAHPQVVAVAPFVEFQGMALRGSAVETAAFFGLSPEAEAAAAALPRALGPLDWERFRGMADGVIFGTGLAEALGLEVGDRATLIAPTAGDARFRHLIVVGLLNTGTELDEAAAFLHLETAAALTGRAGGIDGYRLHLRDLFSAPRTGWELIRNLPRGYYAQDWTQTHGNLYAAIQMSRRLVVLLLLSIIAVAAFNLVSSLVLVVMDKRGDIAILRALGATPADINGVFLRQGLLIALAGAGLGSALGALLSLYVTELVAGIEAAFGVRFLDTDVYPLAYLPSDLRLGDFALINGAALALCFLAALYPARRAALAPPAEALRHE